MIKDEVEHLREDCREANFSMLSSEEYNAMSLRLTTEEAFHFFPAWVSHLIGRYPSSEDIDEIRMRVWL